MRRGTLKIFTFVALGFLATPFSAEARRSSDNSNNLGSGFQAGPRTGGSKSGFSELRASGQEDVSADGTIISQQVQDFRGIAGVAGTHGLQEQFDQNGRPVSQSRIFPGNYISLATDSLADGSQIRPIDFAAGLDDRVKRLQVAANNKDDGGAISASKEIWDWMTRAGLNHRFLESPSNKVKIDDLGQALCVDGETANGGRVQDYLEKGFKGAQIDFVDQQKNDLGNYSPNSSIGNGVPSSALSGATGGVDTENVLSEKSTAETDATSAPDGSHSAPPRAPRISLDETRSAPARAPRDSVPPDTRTNIAYGNCAPTPVDSQNQNQNQNRDNNNDKNAKNKNPGDKNPGDPKSPPPENPPPQLGGGQGGGGGQPKPLDKVDIAKGGPAQPFRGPNAEADGFNYLQAIKEAGQFDGQYDYSKIIKGMELNNLQQVQIRADFFAATPIVRYGGGVAGGQTAAASNRARLDQLANTGNSSARDQPFNGLFGK